MDHSTDIAIKRGLSIWIISFLLLSNFILITPASATTSAVILFSKDFGSPVTWVDTNSDGSMVFAALENGSIIGMTSNGSVVFNTVARSGYGVSKIVSDDTGNLVWMDDTGVDQQSGYIYYTGVKGGAAAAYGRRVTDIDIAKNGSYWVRFSNDTALSYIRVYTPIGLNPYLYNSPSGGLRTEKGQYDSENELFFATNVSNNSIYMFNISNYTGWLDLNPAKLTKNLTLSTLDSFPYRMFINIPNAATAQTTLTFLPNYTADFNITRKSASEFWYNETRAGHYYLWTNATSSTTNVTLTQTDYLETSYYNSTSKIYNVTFHETPLVRNVSFYYGNPSYTNSILSNVTYINNGTPLYYNQTSISGSFTAPTGVYEVNLSMHGGGSGGTSGGLNGIHNNFGEGGNAAPLTSYHFTTIPGFTYYNTIGNGGSGGGAGIGDGCTAGTAGETTYWNNSASYVATGATAPAAICNGAAAENGNTSTIPYINGSVGGTSYWDPYGACPYPMTFAHAGAAGGFGFGSGGGGGAYDAQTTPCSNDINGAGGNGASGFIQASYFVNNIGKYFWGSAPSSIINTGQGNITYDSAMNYVSQILTMGNVTTISVPKSGGVIAAGTSTPTGTDGRVYAILYSTTGFGLSYNTTSAASGDSRVIAASDSAVFYIEGRGSEIDIYELDSTLAGNYKTGGDINSVDIAASNGLWAIAGGNDGKTYIFTKEDTSSWTVHYQGDSGASITSVAISDLGDYSAVGRSSGRFEYISDKEDATAENMFNAVLFVNKGGSPYVGQIVNITETSGGATMSSKTGVTDSTGKFVFTAYDGRMYSITINTNEYSQTYMGSSQYPTVTINIPVPILTRPYVYASTFNDTDGIITSTYQDVNAATVNIKIYNTKTNTLISDRDYVGVTSVNDVVSTGDATQPYKAVFSFTRTTGAQYQDTIYLQSTLFHRVPTGTSDQNTLFIYAVYTVMLMVISLAVGAASIKFGVVFLVALTFAGIIFGFLPWSLYSVGVATSAFIAMLEVFRRHD